MAAATSVPADTKLRPVARHRVVAARPENIGALMLMWEALEAERWGRKLRPNEAQEFGVDVLAALHNPACTALIALAGKRPVGFITGQHLLLRYGRLTSVVEVGHFYVHPDYRRKFRVGHSLYRCMRDWASARKAVCVFQCAPDLVRRWTRRGYRQVTAVMEGN